MFLLLVLLITENTKAQDNSDQSGQTLHIGKSLFSNEIKRNFSRKGDFYVHWGYNHSWYGKSDINFKGPGYDFTLKDVVAHDRQSKMGWEYLDPGKLSIPQYNLRVGYFISDNYSISVGWDHMKYVMDIPQRVSITGYIDPEISTPGIPTGDYAGTYNGEMIDVKADMLTFEHTDGFNYANVEVERYDDIWVAPSQKTSLTLETGLGVGLIVPRTDVRLFGVGQNNYFNVAGYGVSAKAGLKFYLTKGWYIQNTTKVGTTKLTRIHTTGRNDYDKARQNINYIENFFAVGFQF